MAYDHQVVEAVILRDDRVQDLVERSKVQPVLALQELEWVVYFAGNDFRCFPVTFRRTRDDQGRANAVFMNAPAHDGRIALAPRVERAFSVREAGVFPAGLCV